MSPIKSILMVLITCCLANIASAQTKVLANVEVQLNGTCKYELKYGSPGFGENPATDTKEFSFILHLDKAILFKDTEMGSGKWEKVSTIHIIDAENKFNMKMYKNKHISLTATLGAANTGHHHAPAITWDIKQIKIL